jgi:hypothetical protein
MLGSGSARSRLHVPYTKTKKNDKGKDISTLPFLMATFDIMNKSIAIWNK